MREILFRGKSVDNGEWNYGVPIVNTDCVPPKYMMHVCVIGGGLGIGYKEVIPETVGQFTGLVDKNGVEIFEGDVVRTTHKYNKDVVEGSVYFEDYQWFGARDYLGYIAEYCDIEVIGNIHENPELIS